jgi:hypothetical protein
LEEYNIRLFDSIDISGSVLVLTIRLLLLVVLVVIVILLFLTSAFTILEFAFLVFLAHLLRGSLLATTLWVLNTLRF